MAQFTPQEFLATYLAQNNIAALSPREQYIVLGRLQQVLDASAATGTEPTPQRLAVALAGSETIRAQTGINDSQSESLIAALIVSADDTVTYIEENGSVEPPVDPDTPADFTLTKANDKEIFNGTAKSEVFDATELGSLQDGDIIIDTSTTDRDVLNAVVNNNNTAARIQNVEEINLVGEYLTTGFDLTNVYSAKEVNLSTKIAGGTGTITNANSLNAAKISAGANIGTLNVSSLASGTRDTVQIDGGSASKVTITGSANGADLYDVKLAKNAAVTLNTLDSANDAVRLDLAGGKSTLTTGAAFKDNLKLTLNASAEDTVVELTNGGANAPAKNIVLTGSKNITLETATGASLVSATPGTGAVIITDSGSGVSTIKTTGVLAAGQDFQNAKVDVFEIAGTAGASALTLNENTKLNLTGDASADLTVNLDNASADPAKALANGAGTLRVDVSETQAAALITGAKVGTLLIQATPDKVTDTDKDENGFKESSITVKEIDVSAAATKAVVVNGSENLVITELKADDGDAIAASNLTGNLTLTKVTGSAVTDEITIVGGKGNTTLGAGAHKGVLNIQLSSGVNSINLNGAGDGTKVTATGGTNTITSVAGSSAPGDITIKLADGNDSVTVKANNTVTLGGGNDTVNLADNLAGVVVKDFVLGTDTIVLSGAQAAGNIDLSKVAAPTKGAYFISGAATGAGVWGITLENGGTGLTATDLRNSVQLDITAKDASTVIAGDLNDIVAVKADESATITTGGGKDKVVLNAGDQTTATVKDFTVGSDTIVVTGALSDNFGVNLKNVAEASGAYTIGDGGSGNKGAIFTLQNGGKNITTDGDLTGIVQLGSSTAAYLTVKNDGSATENVVVTGGSSNDFVELTGATKMWDATVGVVDAANANKQAVFQFSNNGGMDTIKLNAMDGKDLLNFNSLSGIDTSVGKVDLAASAAKVGDAIDGAVYIFADSSAGAAGAKITTLVAHDANGYTQDVINAEVAAFINAGLGVSAGEKYVVIINDNSTTTYGTKAWGGGTTEAANSYIYLVDGTNDGVSADNITLIGQLYNAGAVDATAAVVL